ncbi:MAG: hypothetical protein CVT49_10835 [candidate division Zixibacteria bacterium HGW-Zixibacteria-1]|nr:MAG: hypothetical protein CVT49_10835 [candidate division Zixibacteria bacterium HGW-Zixibacteria-1]
MRLGTILMLLTLTVPAAIFAQSEKEAVPEQAPWMEEAMRLSQPGPEHALLAGLEGKWDMTGWIMPMPGAVPIDFSGKAVNEMILGGRFLEMTSESGEGEMYTETLTILGFDRRSNKYTFVGYDTWGTFYVTAAGGYNDTTKVITMYGEEVDVIAGFTQKYDQAIQIIDKDKFILTTVFYNKEMTGGAEQFKMLEITYTRAK